MLMYVILKPVNVVFGLTQETPTEDSVTLLKSIRVGGSGPVRRKQAKCFIEIFYLYFFTSLCFVGLFLESHTTRPALVQKRRTIYSTIGETT